VDGRVVSRAVVIATGVTCDGGREVLGLDVGDSEDGAFWTAFLRSLKARGLHGVQLVISDAHTGLKQAISAVMAGAGWQRCRVHFLRNVLARVPKASAEMVAAAIRTIFAQPLAKKSSTSSTRSPPCWHPSSRPWPRCWPTPVRT
jgi:putative transposase